MILPNILQFWTERYWHKSCLNDHKDNTVTLSYDIECEGNDSQDYCSSGHAVKQREKPQTW